MSVMGNSPEAHMMNQMNSSESMIPGSHEYEAKIDAIRGLVAEDPARVAQVVRHWIK